MTEEQRLRRVALLCAHFMRNLAYYRAGWDGGELKSQKEFWVSLNSNFYDLCVLEWCKLFADKKDKHYWENIIEDKAKFQASLLYTVDLTNDEYDKYIDSMRRYRDKFVAHLDSENKINLPRFEIAKKAVQLYYIQLLELNKTKDFLGKLPRDITAYHDQCFEAGLNEYKTI